MSFCHAAPLPCNLAAGNEGGLLARHEYEYCDVYVNRSDDNMFDVCFQVSQRLTSDPTTTPQIVPQQD